MYDVITVGSSTVDVFAKVHSDLVKIKTIHHTQELIAYPSGSKILIRDLEFLTGGGGTNTSVSMARLGLKAAYLGQIGDDNNRSLILRDLKKNKVKFLGKIKRGVSGYSIILDSLEGDRTILAYKGVNDFLSFKSVDLKKLNARWFYFSSMVGKSFETLEKIAMHAEKKGISIAFNPSNYLAEKGRHYLKEILCRTDLLVLNKEEAELIAGKDEMPSMIGRLMGLGPKKVVITDGKRGAFTVDKKKCYHVASSDSKPVETTGAGDAFASTFLAGVIKGKNTSFCLKIAAKNAESVIMHKGAKAGLLGWSELNSRVKKNPPKVTVIM